MATWLLASRLKATQDVGMQALERMRELKRRHSPIADVRGIGLLLALAMRPSPLF